MTAAEAQRLLEWTMWGGGLFVFLVAMALIVPRIFPERPPRKEADRCQACGRVPFDPRPPCLLCLDMDDEFLMDKIHEPRSPRRHSR